MAVRAFFHNFAASTSKYKEENMKKTIRTREEVRAAFKAFMLERDAEQKAAQRRFKAHRQTRMAEVV